MPRIADLFLDCVIYLYPSKHEAEEGIGVGGTGFLVSVPAEKLDGKFVYAVTNAHIIEAGSSCVRLNTVDGEKDVFVFSPERWTCSKTDDIAAMVMPALPQTYIGRTIPKANFITEKIVADNDIGPGDEVIIMGRFINHEGKQKNRPLVRFGFLSQNPAEPVEYYIRSNKAGKLKPRLHSQESFLAEVKSIGGFSGSPVFLAPSSLGGRTGRPDFQDPNRTYLVGIDWGHINDDEPVRDSTGEPLDNGHHVTANTGMMGIVPAWKLIDLLMEPEMVEHRRKEEEKEIEKRKAPKAVGDTAVQKVSPTSDSNPAHKEDFTALLDEAAQKQK